MRTGTRKLLMLLFILGWSGVLRSQTIITTIGSVTHCPGEIILSVNVTGFTGVGSFSMVLNVNPAIVDYTGFQNLNPALAAGTFLANEVNGSIYLSWFGGASATISNGSVLVELICNGYSGSSGLNWDTQTPGSCEYTNVNGQILSSSWINGAATIHLPPSIGAHPTDKFIYKGSNTTFTVSASGANLVYLWQGSTDGATTWTDLVNGGYYSNVTAATLNILNAPVSLSGSLYRCKVSGSCLPFAFSNAALLTVTPYINTICQSVTSCPGEIIVQVMVDDFTDVGAFSLALNVNAPNLTYTGFQNLNPGLSSGTFTSNASGGIIYLSWYGAAGVTLPNGVLVELKFTGLPGTGALVWDLQTPGNCEYSAINGSILYANWVNGNITIQQPPLISVHPVNKVIATGNNTYFSATAAGTGLTYLWQVSANGGASWFDLINGGHYSNVSNPTMNISDIPLDWNGYHYRCRVTGTCLPVAYTNPALLTVTPLIITTCKSVTSCPGEVIVPVTVEDFIGVGAFSMALSYNSSMLAFSGYQNFNATLNGGTFTINAVDNYIYLSWYSTTAATLTSGANLVELKFAGIPGSAILAWDTQTPGNCEYSDVNGVVIFSNWINGNCIVTQPPVITSHPANKTIFGGGSANFAVSANGAGLHYQWQISTNSGSTWTDLTNVAPYSGATGASLTVNPVAASMNGNLYRCYVTGTCAPYLYSLPALLTVTQTAITTAIPNISNSCTGNFNLPVNVTNCVNVGGISLALQFDPAKMSFEGYHTIHSELLSGILVINQLAGIVYFSWASTDPADVGSGTLVYLRFKANPGITATLSWDTETAGNCEYSDINGAVIASFYNNANVTIASNALMVSAGNDITIAPGSAVQLNGLATGGFAPYSYQWTPATWLSNPSIPNPVANPLSAIAYTLTVTGNNNCVGSDAMKITVVYNLPQVATASITGVTFSSATGGGTVINDGGAAVTLRGVCWGIADAPTINDGHTEDGAGLGAFTSNLTGLTGSTMYYVRGYATNSAGTAYGNQVSFTTLEPPVNLAPTINPIPNPLPITEDAGQQTIYLSGISDGNPEQVQNISISASSSDQAIIPNPNVNYIQNDSFGSLNFTPVLHASGNATISVTVMDEGGTANGGVNSATTTFDVVVLPVNDPPVANAGPDQSTATLSLVVLDGSGSYDVDGNQLSFTWTAPAGIVLSDPSSIHPTFTTPFSCIAKTYSFGLTVNDGAVNSAPDYIVISVSAASPLIDLHPYGFSETLFAGNASVQELTIKNEGLCNLLFTLSEPVSWLTIPSNNGTISPGDSIILIVHFNAENLNAGTYNSAITIHSNDPLTPNIYIPVALLVIQPLAIQAYATPSSICLGGSAQLHANATGGSGYYTYLWSSDPPGFISGLQNPLVNPGVNTTYLVTVSDGQFVASANVSLLVHQNQPPGPVLNMLPADGSIIPQPSVTFSWQPSVNANLYDLYVWKTGDPPSAQPIVANLSAVQYTSNNLNYATTYNWKLIAKNACSLQTQSNVQSFSVAELPDLIVNNILVPVNPSTGQQIEISWTVFNQGNNGTQNTNWFDVAYLSQDTILNTNVDTYLGGLSNLTSLSQNTGYTRSLTVVVPEDVFGSLNILVKTDHYTQVPEMNENNNLSHEPVNIGLTPPPDLQVTSSIVPTIAFSGTTINIDWITKNAGAGAIVNKTWTDRIYLSQQPIFNPQVSTTLGEMNFNFNLLPDGSYTGSKQVTLPGYITGNYYIFIYTDVNNTVFEHANESNNILRSAVFEIVLTPPPDLTVIDIQHPMAVSNNELMTISWTLKNTGASATVTPWTDKIFICPVPEFDAAVSTAIGSKQHNVSLQPGETLPDNLQVTIPDKISGLFYVFVYTDYYNQVFEHLNENNNIIRSSNLLEIQHADLTVITPVTADTAWSGQSVMAGWKIVNQGTGTVINKTITDKIFLSQSSVFPPVNPIRIGSLSYTNLIVHGDTLQKNSAVSIPDDIAGKYYLFVIANADTNVFENQMLANNHVTDSLYINISPYPDLVFDSISNPDTIVLGYSCNIHYRVKNTGDANIFGKAWNDGLYLSNSNVTDTVIAVKLKDIQINQSLNIGSTYALNFQVLLPIDEFQGMSQVFLHFYSDNRNNVLEKQENNNTAVSTAIRLMIPPKVDLQVTALSTAIDTTQSGESFTFTYTVKNLSTPTTIWEITQWADAVYLSVDTAWDQGDQMISGWQVIKNLPSNGAYSENRSFTVPQGLSGNYYFLVVTDHSKLNNDQNYINNSRSLTGSIPVFIRQTFYPDLKAEEFSGPFNGNAGQPVKFKWKVSNTGVGPTTNSSWTDKIFISTDFTLSAEDILAGSRAISQPLNVNAFYNDSLEILLPGNISGNYIVILKTDANNNVYETGQGEINNVAFSGINIVQPLPSDLIVQDITFPGTVETGQTMTLNYKNKNIGVNPATGYMKDIVYISADSAWNFTDPKFGINDNHINIAPQMNQPNSMNSTIPGLVPGDYFVLVQTNVLNNIPEVDMQNNTGISSTKMTVTMPQLTLGVQKTNVLTDDVARYYEVDIPQLHEGETMIVTLKGDSVTGMNELYLCSDSIPTRSSHTFSATEPFKGNQELIVPELQTGKYYLLVFGSTANGNTQDVILRANILPFEIRSVNAAQGGNKGNVTVLIQGARFEPGMTIQLGNGSSVEYFAQNISLINSTKLFATFNLNNAITGLYNVIAKKADNATTVLTNGFEIVAGSPGNSGIDTTGFECYIENIGFDDQINTDIQHPSSTRPNRIVAISIHFANNGNVDIPAPGRLLVSLTGVPLSFDPEDFTAGKQEVYIEFKENNGPPGILRPGAQGTVTVYTKATVIATLQFVLTR